MMKSAVVGISSLSDIAVDDITLEQWTAFARDLGEDESMGHKWHFLANEASWRAIGSTKKFDGPKLVGWTAHKYGAGRGNTFGLMGFHLVEAAINLCAKIESEHGPDAVLELRGGFC